MTLVIFLLAVTLSSKVLTQFKDFSHGFRTNNITPQSLQAGQNIELKNTPYGRNIYRANGNTLITQIPNEKIIGGFDYEKGDNHYELIFTNTGTESKAYLFTNETLTSIKTGMSKDAKHFNAVNFNNGAFITNGVKEDTQIFYEYGVGATDIDATAQGGEKIRGLAPKVYDNRIFIETEGGLYQCGLGDHTDWSSSEVAKTRAGYEKNFLNRSSSIKAIETYKDSLMIYRTTDTVKLSGTSGSYEMNTISNVGATSPFAVSNLDDFQMYFLKHINGVGLYYLSNNALGIIKAESEISQFIHETFENIDNTRLDEIYVLSNTKKNEVWVHIPRTDYPNNAYWLIYNLTAKCFYPPRITQPITSAWLYKGEIHIGTADGKVLREDYGETFDGSAISFSADTCSLDFNTLTKKEFGEQCQYVLDGKIQNNFILSFIRDDDESTIINNEIIAVPNGCLIWAPNEFVTDPKYFWGQKWAGTTPLISKCGKPSSFSTVKFRFSGTGSIGLLSFETSTPTLA